MHAVGLVRLLGYAAFADASPAAIAIVTATAAGAVLAMLVDTMIPEATGATRDDPGLIAVIGFPAAFVLTKAGG